MKNKYVEDHEKTIRADLTLEVSKLINEIQGERARNIAQNDLKIYAAYWLMRHSENTLSHTEINNYLQQYGDKRIKDMKNFKTTKNGEEFVRGSSGIQRSFESYYDKNSKTMRIYKTNTYYV